MRRSSGLPWAGALLAASAFLTGCGDFWQAPGTGTAAASFGLTNSGNIAVSPGATIGNSSTITVTPNSSFTGTVTLTCSVASPAGAGSPATCSLTPASVDITGTTALTATVAAATTSSTTSGAYTITVTGTSGTQTATTSVCAEVSTTAATCGTAAAVSGVFYVASSSSLAGYAVSSGALTAVAGSSYSLNGATALAVSPDGTFLYVASVGAGVVVYSIDSGTGALTQGSEVVADSAAQSLQVDPSGGWLLDASLAGTLTAYPITSAGTRDSNRSVQQVELASDAVQQMAISPDGSLISVALGSAGTQSFSFNADNASPIGPAYSPITKPFGSAGAALSVAFAPNSRLLYIGETAAFPGSSTNSGALRVFSAANGSLTEFSYTAPYAPLGTGPHGILAEPTGSFVYAASWQSGSSGVLSGYAVSTSALTPLGATVSTGTEPSGLAEDNTGSYVLAVSNGGGPLLNAYTFDASQAGVLDASLTGSTVANPITIAALPAVQQ